MSGTKKWWLLFGIVILLGALVWAFLAGREAMYSGQLDASQETATSGYANFSVIGYNTQGEEILKRDYTDVRVMSDHYDLDLGLSAGTEVWLQVCRTQLTNDPQIESADCWTQEDAVIECPRSVTIERRAGMAGFFGRKTIITSDCIADIESISDEMGIEFIKPTASDDTKEEQPPRERPQPPRETERTEETREEVSATEPEVMRIDGTRLLQVVEGDTVTHLTTIENIQDITRQTTNVTNVTQMDDTLASLSCNVGQIAKWTGSTWACADDDAGVSSDYQLLSLVANQLSISNGNSVDLSIYLDNTDLLASISCANAQTIKYISGSWQCADDNDGQTLSLSGNVLSLVNGGSVDLGSLDTLANLTCSEGQVAKYISGSWVCAQDNDHQDITLVANQLSIENGSSVDLSVYLDNTDLLASISCANGQTVKYIGGTWQCADDNDTNTTYVAGSGITITGGNVINAVLGDSITTNEIVDSAVTTAKIANQAITLDKIGPNGCTAGQIMKYNGAAWACAADDNTNSDTTYTAGTGVALNGTEFSLNIDSLPGVSSMASTDYFAVTNGATSSKITYDNLFSDILGSLNYRGTWDADNNTPDLTGYCDAEATKGHYYVVSTAGSTDLDGNSDWLVHDWAVCGDGIWQRIQGTALVASVFGRTGAITAQNGDYIASQITNTPSGGIASGTVQAALNELDAEKLATSLAPGMVYVGNDSSQAAAVNVSGDIALASNGVATVASGAIDSAKIADGSIQFGDLASNGCTAGQIIKYDGTDWVCGEDENSSSAYQAGAGLSLASDIFAIDAPTCTGANKLLWSGSSFTCGADLNTDTTYTAGEGIEISGSNVISAVLGDSITSDKIVNGTIQTVDLADGSVTSAKIADGTIVAADIAPNTLDFAQFTDDMTLDATTTIALGANDFVIDMNGSGDFDIQSNGTSALLIMNDGSFRQQVANDSDAAFTVNNADGDSLFTIDSDASLVYIGDPTPGDQNTLLVVDRKNTAGDPSGVNGAMYYNTASNRFRCYENDTWKNCIGGGSGTSDILTATQNVTGQPNINEPRPNNGMTAVPELAIQVDPGVTMRADYHLIIDQPAPAWGISINFPAYEAGEIMAGRAQWINATNSNTTTWRSYALTPATPNFTRGVYDNTVGRPTNNIMTITVTWRNDSTTTKEWGIEFGNDIVVNNANAIPVVRNNGSAVMYTLN